MARFVLVLSSSNIGSLFHSTTRTNDHHDSRPSSLGVQQLSLLEGIDMDLREVDRKNASNGANKKRARGTSSAATLA